MRTSVAMWLVAIIPAGCHSFVANTGEQRKPSTPGIEEGFIPTTDGPKLYYQKIGEGGSILIAPGRLFLFEDFRRLADTHTLISYDMRNRGRSDRVEDGALLTIEKDVEDLEIVRRHFGVDRFTPIGYSYLGLMVVMYAMEYPEHVEGVIQIGPVPLRYGTEYPAHLTARDETPAMDPEALARIRRLRAEGHHLDHPRDYCEQEWQVTRFQLVGDPAKVDVLGKSPCDMPNEWPTNLVRHLEHHFQGSVQKLEIPPDRVRQVNHRVLTIHGTRDRNAPYGAGLEWASMLPNARLLTVDGAAHQCFGEAPEVVFPAIRTFLIGEWPAGAEAVTRN